MAAGYGPRRRFLKAAAAAAGLVFARPAGAAPVRLLVLGDSLAAGYGLARQDAFQTRLAEALQARGHEVAIVDGAVSGDTTAGGRARLDWVLADGVDVAIVELGGNDGLRGLDPSATAVNLAAILDALAAKRIAVLLSGMLAPPNLGPDYGREFQAVFDRLGARAGVIYDPFFLQGVARDPALNQPDGIHPNPEGVRRIVARLLPLVERLLAQRRAD
jgi:acyl-CoA thioesterase-1